MADNLNSLEQLEREIADYRIKFQQSSQIIDELVQVKFDIEVIASEYQKLNNEHQVLTGYINQSKAELSTLQVKSRNNIDEIVWTQKNFHRIFYNFENTAKENINQKFKILNQQFEGLKNVTEQRLKTSLNQTQQALKSLQNQSTDAVNKITQTEQYFNQRFETLERNNLEQRQQTQESLDRRFTTIDTKNKSKWVQFEQQNYSQINTFKNNFDQHFAELTEDIDIRLEEKLNEVKQALNLLKSQSSDAVNKIIKSQEDFNQRFENLERNNLEQIQQTQQSLNRRFTTFETTVELKLKQYQQQISSDITKLEQNNQNLNTKFQHQLTKLNKSIKITQLLTFGAIAIGAIAVIFAIFPLLSKTTDEVKSRNFETTRISNHNNF